jgi:hypothetical protein
MISSKGLLTNASSPWVRGRILASMDEVVSARIRLAGERNGGEPAPLFVVLERARGAREPLRDAGTAVPASISMYRSAQTPSWIAPQSRRRRWGRVLHSLR